MLAVRASRRALVRRAAATSSTPGSSPTTPASSTSTATGLTTTWRSESRSRNYATLVDGPSGYKLAALDAGQATASLSLVFKAGTRYEPSDKAGVANVWRNFAFKGTKDRSELGTVRETELYGGVLSTSIAREYVTITAEFLKGDEEYFASILASFKSTLYTPHELLESVLPLSSPPTLSAADEALEIAHKVAFHEGLGKSLFTTPDGHVYPKDIKAYGEYAWRKGNVGVVATGLGEGILEGLVKEYFPTLEAASTATSSAATSINGGTSTIPSSTSGHGHGGHGDASKAVFIGYAVPSSTPELSVLSSLLSITPSTKWGVSTNSLLSPLSSSTHLALTPILLPYSDAALFGALLSSSSSAELEAGAKKVVEALKTLTGGKPVKEEEVKKAIQKAKFTLASEVDTRDGFVNSVARQLFGGQGNVKALGDALGALDGVSAASLSKFAAGLSKQTPTFVTAGDAGVWAKNVGL